MQQNLNFEQFKQFASFVFDACYHVTIKEKLFASIIVGGTNGKGSTCCYTANILSCAGYRVGCYYSPHLMCYNERITINQEPISQQELLNILKKIATLVYSLGNNDILKWNINLKTNGNFNNDNTLDNVASVNNDPACNNSQSDYVDDVNNSNYVDNINNSNINGTLNDNTQENNRQQYEIFNSLYEEIFLDIASKIPLSIFQIMTIACYMYFIEQKIHIAIFEVGLGGRLDPTNIFSHDIAVITGVDLDHCAILGDTIEIIAKEKSHIYQVGSVGCFYGSDDPPNTVIDRIELLKLQDKFFIFGRDFGYIAHNNKLIDNKDNLCFSWQFYDQFGKLYALPYPALFGKKQLYNAALAIAIARLFAHIYLPDNRLNYALNNNNGLNNMLYNNNNDIEHKTIHTTLQIPYCPIKLSDIKHGITKASILGRFHVIAENPQTVLDVAHNPQSVKIMLDNLTQLRPAFHTFAIFALLNDKDIDSIISLCNGKFTKWFVVQLDSNRGMKASYIKEIILNKSNHDKNIDKNINKKIDIDNFVETCDNIKDAITKVNNICIPSDRIICFGSFILIGQLYAYLYNR